ncbi:hypothetical protein [Haloglomus halophilum]|uniref:hypothetical protein n=1 Tax=Haloglomus halophilum TaxID=2962672 RepID=UPI0020C96C2F|nr:hypothetical protein [Haloglomus halophilum]
MAGYYDFVLGAIPLAAASIATALFLGGIVLTTAISLGCVVAAGLVGHAMFVRTPGRSTTTAAAESTPSFDVAD